MLLVFYLGVPRPPSQSTQRVGLSALMASELVIELTAERSRSQSKSGRPYRCHPSRGEPEKQHEPSQNSGRLMLKAVLIPRAVRCESFFVILNAANHLVKRKAMHYLFRVFRGN